MSNGIYIGSKSTISASSLTTGDSVTVIDSSAGDLRLVEWSDFLTLFPTLSADQTWTGTNAFALVTCSSLVASSVVSGSVALFTGSGSFNSLSTINNVTIGGTPSASTDAVTVGYVASNVLVFKTIVVSGQSNVVADSLTDTLTLAAGTNIAITTDATTDTITIATTGLGTAAVKNTGTSGNNVPLLDGANTWSGQQAFGQATLTSSSNSIAWNANTAQTAVHTLTENTTLANPTNLVAGATYVLKLIQHASSAKTLAFGSAYKWPSGSAPVISTTLSAVDLFTFYSDGTNMYGVCQKGFA